MSKDNGGPAFPVSEGLAQDGPGGWWGMDLRDYLAAKAIQGFCRSRGYVYLTVPAVSGLAFYGDDGDVYHEISGPSPMGGGVFHAVVGRNGEIVFDPHPSRAGLDGTAKDWDFSYLVKAGEA